MATLYSNGLSIPVKIRDLSPYGAQIEAANLPAAGSEFRLSRGSLGVSGKIIWVKAGRAGVKFDTAANVEEWLPNGRSANAQQRIDQVVHDFKAQSHPSQEIQHPAANTLTCLSTIQTIRDLVMLAEDLAAQPDIMSKFGARLRTLDDATNLLEKSIRANRF